MQPKSQRRTHSAEFKAQVLAECQQSGASVAGVALAHGLNINLLRKWLVGRGIKRTGLSAPRTVTRVQPVATESSAARRFVPVELAPAALEQAAISVASDIHVELACGGTRLSVRWPAAQADSCSAWLRELALAVTKE